MASFYRKTFASREEAMQEKLVKSLPHLFVQDGTYFHKSTNQSDDDGYYSGMESHSVSEEDAQILTVKEEPLHCKIFKYFDISSYDAFEAPHGHNYKSSLSSGDSLFPKEFLVRGELQKTEWYSDKQMTDLVLIVEFIYTRDMLGFATERKSIRTWIREDGSEHPNKKTKEKTYSDLAQIREGVTRRGNIYKGLQKPVLGMLIATASSMPAPWNTKSQIELIIEGRNFMKNHKENFSNFVDESHKDILEDIKTATEPWLDNPIDVNGTTIRKYILNEINLEDDPNYIL